MGARALTSAFKTATLAPVISPVLFTEFNFTSGYARAWSGYGTLTWNGNDFLGLGDYVNIGSVEESVETAAKGTSFTLSGIPSDKLALALGDEYQGRSAKMWIGGLADDGTVIVDPYLIFSGRMDVIEIQDGGDTASITLTAENRLIDLQRSKERRWTDEDQKIDYPTDTSFSRVAALQNKTLLWGVPGGNTTTAAGNNSTNGDDSAAGLGP